MRILLIACLLTFGLGCKEKSEPCSGLKFDVVTLPLTFTVSSQNTTLGTVTIDADQNATFEPSPDVGAEKLKRFRADFDALSKADAANYRYSDRDDDTHYSCGGSVKKGTPEYPSAFKMALYSDYYEVDDKK